MGCVIVGAGPAGLQAALTVRASWPEVQVTVLDGDREAGYYRALLPQFINRSLPEDKLFIPRPQDDPLLEVGTDARVEGLDRYNRQLLLRQGPPLSFRRLIIASGGKPIVPPVCAGEHIDGIFPVRNLSVARRARDWLPANPVVVILGGGLVGVKTAAHLAGFGFSVTVVEKEPQLLPQALSVEASRFVERCLQKLNIRILLGATVDDLQVKDRKLRAVNVAGRWLPGSTLLVAAGSAPEIGFLESSGLLQDGCLEVSTTLQTRDPSIYAVGDAVTIVDEGRSTPWTWPQATLQGGLAARNLFGPSPQRIGSMARVNTMNLNGYPLAIFGAPVDDACRLVWSLPEQGVYRELYHRDGRLVGGALLGDISRANTLHGLMQEHPADRWEIAELLVPAWTAIPRDSASCRRFRRRATIVPARS